jgi:hypothetical protein
MKYKIEKNIPYKAKHKGEEYSFDKLEVGDNILIPCSKEMLDKTAMRIRYILGLYKLRINSSKKVGFAIRTNSDGIRVWRLE